MSLANSEDPDGMSYNAAFHQDLRYLVRQKKRSSEEIQYFPDIITHDPSNYTMNHPRFTVSNQKEESIYVL